MENGVQTLKKVKIADYTYDAAGNVISITDANGNSATNTFDKKGNLLQTTDRCV